MQKEIEDIELIALSLSISGHHLHADKLLEITARLKSYAAHLTPESLASSQAVVNASALEQSDSVPPPAQAQVV